jgi:hypothetical protein
MYVGRTVVEDEVEVEVVFARVDPRMEDVSLEGIGRRGGLRR